MEPIHRIDSLGLCFALLSVDCLPEEWVTVAMEAKRNRRVFIQFLNPSCLVSELIPFLVYNVHQAFKYGYNFLRGFEQELLIALYGRRSFQEASSIIGVSVSQKATVLVISEEIEELKEAVDALKEGFSRKGCPLKPFSDDRELFKSFWEALFSKNTGVKTLELDYSQVLNLVKERIATGYI
ncbi:MAG: hypothetical protein QW385_04760 [Thermoproteota archaeon]